MVSKNEKTSSFESGVLQIRRKSNKIDKNEKFLNREFNKSEFVVLLIYIYAFYIKKCYFSSATVRNQRNIVIVGGSNHEISLSLSHEKR